MDGTDCAPFDRKHAVADVLLRRPDDERESHILRDGNEQFCGDCDCGIFRHGN
jgi:hypothetical protein